MNLFKHLTLSMVNIHSIQVIKGFSDMDALLLYSFINFTFVFIIHIIIAAFHGTEHSFFYLHKFICFSF